MSQPIGTPLPLLPSQPFRILILMVFTVALLSVYDKTGLLELAQALSESGVRLLGSGGTAKKIREAGIQIECVLFSIYVEDVLKMSD